MIIQNMIINADTNQQLQAIGQPTTANLYAYVDTKYLIKANLVVSYSNSNAYAISNTCSFAAYLGNLYGCNAAPILSITDSNVWNQTAEWANVDCQAGTLCFELDTSNAVLMGDINNSSSKTYDMQIVGYNNSNTFMICDTSIILENAAVIP